MRRRTLIRVWLLGAVAVLAALAALGPRYGAPWPSPAALWPIDLARPAGPLLDWRLAAMRSDRSLCRRVLQAPYIEAQEIADADQGAGCGWSNSVRVRSMGGARLSTDKLTCELAAALASWVAHEVQPSAEAILGDRVASVQHRGSYACRNIRGSPFAEDVRSEHASANALDVAGFTLSGGRQVSVLKHWGAAGPEGRFLAQVHRSACRYFRVAIGPAYNAAHRDHFHYDRGDYRACR